MPLPRPDESQIGKGWLFDIGPSTLASDRFWSTFGAVFCWSMLAYLIWRNNQSAHRLGEVKLKNWLWWSACIAISTFGLNQLSAMFVVFPWVYDGKDCMLLSIINTWLYFGSKFFLWLYGIIRLHDVFHKSGTLAYKVWFLKTLVVIFAIECVLINVLHILFDDATVHHGLCVVYTADFIPPVMAMIDILSNLLCLWLFYAKMRRLWQMISNVQADNVSTQTVELAYIIRKYTVLTGFSVVSTILLGASVAITPMLFTMLTFDSIINVLCLILFDKRFDHIYQVLCCCCAKRLKFDELIQKIKAKAVQTVEVVTNQKAAQEQIPSVEKTETATAKVSYAQHGTQPSNVVTQTETTAVEQQMESQIQLSTLGDAAETVTGYDMNAVDPGPEETVTQSGMNDPEPTVSNT